ncbi:MAG: selenite/tellurite reduction operon porin ExtI [Betaproteobacteria bacterium]
MTMVRCIRSALPIGVLLAFLASLGVSAASAQQAEPAQTQATQQVANALSSIKLNYAFQLYGQWRDTGSGPNGTDDTTDIYFRRNRLMMSGQMTDIYGFYAAIQFVGDERIFPETVSETPRKDFDVIDTFLVADYTDAFRIRAGLTKDPLIREDNENCFAPLSVDRSYFVYTDLTRLNRDFGVVVWGNLADALVQYRLAAMKGNDDINDPKSTLRYTARVHLSLLDPEYSLVYSGTYLGKKKVLTVGAGYQTESDAVYGNVAGKDLVKDYQAYTYDVFFEYPTPAGTFTVSGAYLKEDFDGAYKGTDPDPRSIGINGEKKGWYTKAGYMLPDSDLQVFGRYEKWRFAELVGIFDQEIKWTAVGLNYYFRGQDMRFTLEYSTNDYEKEDTFNKDYKTVTVMLQFRI